jgi:hypothetical protein
MNARKILGCLLFAVALLLPLTQIYFLHTLDQNPRQASFMHAYAVQSSIESFGVAFFAVFIGLFVFGSRARVWLWLALIVSGTGLWLFVIRELWLHYYEVPHRYPQLAALHQPYIFTGPLWLALIRLSWHIIFPAAFILAATLLLRRAPNTALEPTPTAP